jgi:hypothetical protein
MDELAGEWNSQEAQPCREHDDHGQASRTQSYLEEGCLVQTRPVWASMVRVRLTADGAEAPDYVCLPDLPHGHQLEFYQPVESSTLLDP